MTAKRTKKTKFIFVDVDIQNDFCDPSGSLYVKGSPNELYRELTTWAVAHHVPILGSVDSHAWDAWEFASSDTPAPSAKRPEFPDHCVKGTPGWLKIPGTLPPRFRFIPNVPDAPTDSIARELRSGATQGVYFEKEVYSLFANPLAEGFVKALLAGDSPEFIVYGVAADYCVKAAAIGLAQRGYKTAVLTDAIAGITAKGTASAIKEMKAAGVRITQASELLST